MSSNYLELSQYLQRLEHELRMLGWWSDTAPPADAFESSAPFCHDSMAFEQWLQWVFLPKLQEIIRRNAPLPGSCAIAPMAEVAWHKQSPDTVAILIQLLDDIDSCISSQ